MKTNLIIFILFSFAISGCSFNKMYLAPDVIPNKEIYEWINKNDEGITLVIDTANNFQPLFTDVYNEPVRKDYTIESIVFDSENENKLNGWLISPLTDFNGITILFFHGNSGNILTNYKATIPFVKRGFQVFIFDYSGFGFSEGKATRKNLLIDGQTALDYLISNNQSNRETLLLYGQSLGGHLSINVASRNQEKIDGLITEAAFSSHKDIGSHFAWIFGRLLVAEKYSGLKAIRKYKKPLLIIHSTEDKTVPFEMGQKLFKNANEPKMFYQIEQYHICGPFYYADSIVSKINSNIVLKEE